MMESIKRLLLGIAIILFGSTLAIGGIWIFIGWGVAFFGLVIALTGYFLGDDIQ